MATVRTLPENECVYVDENDWTLVLDNVEGYAFVEDGFVRVLWGDVKPSANDHGMNMPANTQINNRQDARMWCRTDRYSGKRVLIRTTVVEV